MKKAKGLAMLVLALSLFISGCFSGDRESELPLGDNSGETALNKMDQVIWFSDVSDWTPPSPWSTDLETVEGQITDKTGLTFDFNIPVQDGATKLSLMLISGQELPDVMTVTNEVLAKKLIQANKVWSIKNLLEQHDPGSHLLQDFPDDMKQVISERDGGWYAFPSHISTADARKRYPPSSSSYEDRVRYHKNFGIMINQKILTQLGLTIEDVSTEDGLTKAYQKIKDMKLSLDGAPVIPLQVDGRNYQVSTLEVLQDMFGVMAVDKDGSYRGRILAPETKHVLKFLNQAAQAKFFEAGQLTMDNSAVRSEVMSGRVFSFIGNTANTGLSEMDYWVSPGPILSSEGTKPVIGKSSRPGPGWMQTYISKTTKYPEKLAKWLTYMSSDEGMTLHNFGIEGEHFIRNEQGLIVQTDIGKSVLAHYAQTGVGAFWPFANISWNDSVKQAPTSNTGPDATVAMSVQTAFGRSEHTVYYDTTPLELPADFMSSHSKWLNIQEQIDVFVQSQISKVIMAENDAAFNKMYDELIIKVKALGIESINTEINKQVQKQMDQLDIKLKGINS